MHIYIYIPVSSEDLYKGMPFQKDRLLSKRAVLSKSPVLFRTSGTYRLSSELFNLLQLFLAMMLLILNVSSTLDNGKDDI